MTGPSPRPLLVGIPGPALDGGELALLQQVRPAGVVLFARNLIDPEGARRLVASLQELDPPVLVAIDLEGGAVNRLASVWGELPSPARAAAAGRKAVLALGEAAGAACRNLGIHLDFAPVIDLACCNGMLASQERCLGDDPARVTALAGLFVQGLTAWGVSGCLKHFPGLGPVVEDTHEDLPVLSGTEESLRPHISAFEALTETVEAVMVAHAVAPALGDPERPASLSRALVERAAALPGSPVILSDDLEMGALDEWGELEDRVVAALRARNHGVLVCKAFEDLPGIASRIDREADDDARFRSKLNEASARLGTFATGLFRTIASVPAPDDGTVARLWAVAREEAGL